MSGRTHTLEEVAELTGYDLERVRRAVEAGNLALTQTSGPEQQQRVTDVELERWWNGVEHKPAIDEERSGSTEGS